MEESNVCRVCMINSEVFEYCNLMERQIFKNIKLCDAFKLITGLDISNEDDYPKMICLRCEKQLQDAYHFRQLASSSLKHFAAMREKNSNHRLQSPRILNSTQKGMSITETTANLVLDANEQWIEIDDQNSQIIDPTLKSEVDDKAYATPEVYMVDMNDEDGNIEVKPRELMKPSQSLVTSSANTKCVTAAVEDNKYDCSDDDSSDAISFLLNNKHRKIDEDLKRKGYKMRRFECTVCTKKFVGKSNLLDHLRYHANIRDFKCSYCDKAFVQKGSLICHLRTHTAERPFVCSHCTKGFAQKSALTVHIRTHTQERNFVCDTCNKAFMTTGDLVKHKLIHEPVKKYSCEICGMRTAQKVNMKKHRLRVHGIADEKVYSVTLRANEVSQT